MMPDVDWSGLEPTTPKVDFSGIGPKVVDFSGIGPAPTLAQRFRPPGGAAPSVAPPGASLPEGPKINRFKPETEADTVNKYFGNEATVGGALQNVWDAIKERYAAGGALSHEGAQELREGKPVSGTIASLLGRGEQALSPLTGAFDATSPYLPGLVGAGEGVPAEAPRAIPERPGEPMQLPGAVKPAEVGETSTPMRSPLATGPEKALEPKPEAVGAAVTPTHELLKQNEAALPPPTTKTWKETGKDAAKMVRQFFSPERVDESAGQAAGSIRKNLGVETRRAEQLDATLKPFRDLVNSSSTEEKLSLLKWLQNPKGQLAKGYDDAGIKPFLEAYSDAMKAYEARLKALPQTEQLEFRENFVRQMWKDEAKPKGMPAPKEGSKGFTMKRVFQDYEEGIRAGRVPRTLDPIEMASYYMENAARFIATNEVFNEARDQGMIKFFFPKNAPEGWKKVEGRASYKGYPGQDAYAPEGWATVYNNFISRTPDNAPGKFLTGLLKVTNSISAFKLGMSGYHALNIAGEANVAGLANAIDRIMGGDVLKGLGIGARSMVDFALAPLRGKELVRAYLNPGSNTIPQAVLKVADLAAKANFRVMGKGKLADEYRFSGMGSYWDSWRKGALKGEAQASMKAIARQPVSGTAKAIYHTMARVLDTISGPLFNYYIPMTKNGAYFDMLSTWLRNNPQASEAEQVAFARKASDIIDNRFGEMNRDNIFWHKVQKDIAQAMVVSYSYEVGTARLVMGALRDTARASKEGWTPNMSYAVALPLMIGTLGMAYQYLKTGQRPESLRDLAFPQTAGKDASTRQPERAVLPSYLSQFIRGWYDPVGEITGKKNGLWDLAIAGLTGKDWRGDPIATSNDNAAQALKEWGTYAAGEWTPIPLTQQAKGGSAISGPERFMGIKPAPMYATAPKQYAEMKKYVGAKADAQRDVHQLNQQRALKGLPPIVKTRKMEKSLEAKHLQPQPGIIEQIEQWFKGAGS